MRLHAGVEPLRRDELETPRTRQAMKQSRPAATDDGMNDDAVLVDEPELLERPAGEERKGQKQER